MEWRRRLDESKKSWAQAEKRLENYWKQQIKHNEVSCVGERRLSRLFSDMDRKMSRYSTSDGKSSSFRFSSLHGSEQQTKVYDVDEFVRGTFFFFLEARKQADHG